MVTISVSTFNYKLIDVFVLICKRLTTDFNLSLLGFPSSGRKYINSAISVGRGNNLLVKNVFCATANSPTMVSGARATS